MIVFVHIPRTAGSSIHASFAPHFPGRWLVASGTGDLRRFATEAESWPDRHGYIGGHVGLHDLAARGIRVEPADIRFSVVRETLERAASLYCLMRRSPDWLPHIHPHVGDRDFRYFYEFCRDKGYFFHNDGCRLLSGSQDYEAVVAALEESFDVVGSTASITPFEKALSARLEPTLPGFRIIAEPQNTAMRTILTGSSGERRSGIMDIVGPGFAERVLEDNENDGRLVDFIERTHGGVFVNQSRRPATTRNGEGQRP